ncbi:DUF2975 domain-containing protein [Metasolibacillus meyeri]|uniref:DUF2975 domain-containing protein n=1 Tax=Metasolibacillus meyeri TaxID=1071052 RepID=A0AAW9NFR4_9BACL|nr:DUF2975 domain-containing protein [Metasolibacillus meyeri]MEC1177379.1 DUF2975 domain-containing protein [Metasolibacillus meyeri]
MKKQTLFLKAALLILALPVLALCLIGFPMLVMNMTKNGWELASVMYGIVALLYGTALAYFMALYQALKLLNFIDDHSAFSYDSVIALKKIKWSAFTITGLYVISMPLLYIVAEYDDAPGIILIGLVLGATALVVGVFAAVLQQLLTNAIDMKNENDLTI